MYCLGMGGGKGISEVEYGSGVTREREGSRSAAA